MKQLDPLVDMCVKGLADPRPEALGQMYADLGAGIQDRAHGHVLPSLMASMNDFNKQNLSTTLVNDFTNGGCMQDKLLACLGESAYRVFKNKDLGKTSATASLGLIVLWNLNAEGALQCGEWQSEVPFVVAAEDVLSFRSLDPDPGVLLLRIQTPAVTAWPWPLYVQIPSCHPVQQLLARLQEEIPGGTFLSWRNKPLVRGTLGDNSVRDMSMLVLHCGGLPGGATDQVLQALVKFLDGLDQDQPLSEEYAQVLHDAELQTPTQVRSATRNELIQLGIRRGVVNLLLAPAAAAAAAAPPVAAAAAAPPVAAAAAPRLVAEAPRAAADAAGLQLKQVAPSPRKRSSQGVAASQAKNARQQACASPSHIARPGTLAGAWCDQNQLSFNPGAAMALTSRAVRRYWWARQRPSSVPGELHEATAAMVTLLKKARRVDKLIDLQELLLPHLTVMDSRCCIAARGVGLPAFYGPWWQMEVQTALGDGNGVMRMEVYAVRLWQATPAWLVEATGGVFFGVSVKPPQVHVFVYGILNGVRCYEVLETVDLALPSAASAATTLLYALQCGCLLLEEEATAAANGDPDRLQQLRVFPSWLGGADWAKAFAEALPTPTARLTCATMCHDAEPIRGGNRCRGDVGSNAGGGGGAGLGGGGGSGASPLLDEQVTHGRGGRGGSGGSPTAAPYQPWPSVPDWLARSITRVEPLGWPCHAVWRLLLKPGSRTPSGVALAASLVLKFYLKSETPLAVQSSWAQLGHCPTLVADDSSAVPLTWQVHGQDAWTGCLMEDLSPGDKWQELGQQLQQVQGLTQATEVEELTTACMAALHACHAQEVCLPFQPPQPSTSAPASPSEAPAPTTLLLQRACHGDLRSPNIMVRRAGLGHYEVKFIDLGFAGVAGKDRYPNDLNDDEGMWAPGVAAGKLMTQQHDLQQLLQSLSGR